MKKRPHNYCGLKTKQVYLIINSNIDIGMAPTKPIPKILSLSSLSNLNIFALPSSVSLNQRIHRNNAMNKHKPLTINESDPK